MWALSERAQLILYTDREKENALAKAQKRDPVSDYELNLSLFGRLPFAHPCKHEFLIRCWNHQWPDHLVVEVGDLKNYWLIRMARDFCRYKRLGLLGCASAGKSYALAAYTYTYWKSKPFDTSVYLSTTSAEAGEARAFGTVKDLFHRDKYRIGTLINSLRLITLDEETKGESGEVERDYRNCVKAVLIKSGAEGKNVVGTIVGRKNRNVIWGPQPMDSKVLTPAGWTTIGELKSGDLVVGLNGHKQSVLEAHPVIKKKVFEIEFCDGSKTRSTEDHVWTLQDNLNARPILKKPLSYFNVRLKSEGTPRWSIPRLQSVEFDPVPEPYLSPYIVGVLLGDGSIKQGPSFWSFDDPDVVTHVINELPEEHIITSPREGQFYITHTTKPHNRKDANKVTLELKRLKLLGTTFDNKFVPKEILFGSRETRIKVLQGLLDTDGCVLHSTIRFTSKSPQLRADVVHLVRSLGEYARESPPWTIVINIESFTPFRAQRKLDRMRPSKLAQRRRTIKSITELPEETEVRCITVSNPDGLYVTDDFIVTHNCDEAGFMDAGILDARVNLFSNPFAQFIYVGNGPIEGDPIYIDGEPHGINWADGWRSVDPDVHFHWPTRTGHVLYFNGRYSPNLQLPVGAKPVFPGMMDREKMAEIELTAGGEDTPIFWRQVIGLSPGVDIPDKLITHKLLESNRAFTAALWAGTPLKVVGGLDVGFRVDGDPCSIDFCKVGKETDGRTVAEFERDAMLLIPSVKSKAAFEPQIAEKVIAECRRRGCHYITMDVTGDGGILLQHIERQARTEGYELDVLPVSFSGSADDSVVIPDQKKSAKDLFANKMSQIWGQFRVCVINGVVRGCDPLSLAVKQLVGRKFITDDKKRFLVEPKKEYKKRLKRSPDQGDARTLAAFAAIKSGLSGDPRRAAAMATAQREMQISKPPRYSTGHTQRQLYAGR